MVTPNTRLTVDKDRPQHDLGILRHALPRADLVGVHGRVLMLAGSLGETRILDIVVVLPVLGHRKSAWEGPARRVQLMEKIATRKKEKQELRSRRVQ